MKQETGRHNISLSSGLFLIVATLFLSFALLFMFFQYQREKQYRIEILNTRLQGYNRDICDLWTTDTASFSRYTRRLDDEGMRVTLMNMDGEVFFDSQASDSKHLNNHLDRKEIQQAIKNGEGYDIKRSSSTMGGKWFYSATSFPEKHLIVRTSHIYDVSLATMLASDNGYLLMALAMSILLLFIYYLYTRRLKLNIRQLSIFADMAEKNQDVGNADIHFTDDELGDISRNIVGLYARLQNSEDDKTRLKRQLTQNIAHELKTPVSSIRGYLETIIDNPDMDEQTKADFMGRCYDQSGRLSNLISDITMLSKIDEASGSFTTEAIDISALLEGIRNDVELQLENKKMKFLILVAPKTIVNGNQMLLYSIFRNLTDNAIAYAGEGTTITIQCPKEDSSKYWFVFSDNGTGVPEEHLPHLFERFYRVDKGRSRKLGGTGLGLAIVKNAVLIHGGTISVKIGRAGGLEFRFSLPK